MSFFRKYLIPGFIFQSVVIGGGYATGRELIEFFFSSGPIGGVLGLLTSGLIMGVVLAAAFEFARVHRAYDYRQFCKDLLGRYWVIYEIAFLLLLMLILSVIASAAGELIHASLGLPVIVGTLALMMLIGLLTYFGAEAIKGVLTAWSLLLYALYAALFGLTFYYMGDSVAQSYQEATIGSTWASAGLLYSGYNLAVLPAVLFAVKDQKSRQESIGAGVIAGVLVVIPAILFFVSMMSMYPDIENSPVPSVVLINALQIPILSAVFQIVIFGTFVETGAALLHSVNDRIESSAREFGVTLPKNFRPVIALFLLTLAVVLGTNFGLVELIAKGYNALTLVFILVLIVPLLTIGVWRVKRASPQI